MSFQFTGLIVCGTDTDIGKTVVSAWLVQGLNATYWKPIQSGLDTGGDTAQVCKILNLSRERWLPEAYKFQAAVSPHWAAEKERKCIDPKKLKIPSGRHNLVIETAGGLFVPLNRQLLQIDQLMQWSLPVVLVAKTGLGTLNHTLLSIESLRSRHIPILGLILNGPTHEDNPKTLEAFGNIKILGHLPPLEELNSKELADEWHKQSLSTKFKQLLRNTN